jgi:hypothetical protein
LFDRELGQQSVAGWFKRLRSHEVYSYRSMIATVICTHPLVFLVAEMGAFSLVFATSFDGNIVENFFQKTIDFIRFLTHPTGILRTYVLT